MTMGRPTKYEPYMNEKIKAELSKGHSIQASCSVLGVSSSTVYRWIDEHADFRESIKEGLDNGLHYLEKLVMAHVSGQKLKNFDPKLSSATMLIFTLKTRFHKIYSERNNLEAGIYDPDSDLEWT